MAFKQPLEDAKAVRDALRVVEAVHSEYELAIRIVCKPKLILEGVFVSFLARLERIRVYSYWECAQTNGVVAVLIEFPVEFAAKLEVQSIYQVMDVPVIVKADEVILQKGAQSIARPRQYTENLCRRERHMQKEAQLALPSQTTQLVAKME